MTPLAVTERTVRFGPGDRERLPYVTLPFEVPPGARALRISLSYDLDVASDPSDGFDAAGGNVVDLGLLGPASPEDPDGAFRGWSGSERSVVVVAESAATPGYRPGPIGAGIWHVLLGLYRIAPAGCEVRLRIETLAATPPVPGGVSARPAVPRSDVGDADPGRPSRRRWIACDLHSHSLHSDGADDVGSLAGRARAAGLEALFVTDHNTDAHLPELGRTGSGPLLLAGEEITTYGGHFNALGIERWVDFRHSTSEGVARAIEEIHRQGGLASVNHPMSTGIRWQHGDDLDVDCIEVWNGPWSPEDDAAIAWWDSILATGRRVVAVGGSDTHGPGASEQPVGKPVTWVSGRALDLSSIVTGIRRGRVVMVDDTRTPRPRFRVEAGGLRFGVGETLAVHVRDEALACWSVPGAPGRRARLVVDGAVRYDAPAELTRSTGSRSLGHVGSSSRIRLELRDADGGLVALTNHVFLEGAPA